MAGLTNRVYVRHSDPGAPLVETSNVSRVLGRDWSAPLMLILDQHWPFHFRHPSFILIISVRVIKLDQGWTRKKDRALGNAMLKYRNRQKHEKDEPNGNIIFHGKTLQNLYFGDQYNFLST